MVAHLIITGFVHGVGFRQFVKQHALKLGLKGWVCNTPEGCVEAMFQGEKEVIEKMITFCKKGPFLAEVEKVSVSWKEDSKTFSSFEIIHE